MKRKNSTRAPKVFLSHHSGDKEFVRRLAARLAQGGVETWVDEVNLHIGDSLPDEIGPAIHASDFVVAVISRSSLRSKWVKKELSIALARETASGKRFVLPVMIDYCRLPAFLSDKVYADFTEPDQFDVAVARLFQAMGVSDYRQERSGVAIEWTSEGPRIFSHSTVISATESSALLDRWSEWLPKFIEQEKKRGRAHQDVGPAAHLLAVIRACSETYNRVPDEAEVRASQTELARKFNLFYQFLDALPDASHRQGQQASAALVVSRRVSKTGGAHVL